MFQKMDENNLSQKLTQLSTNANNPQSCSIKEIIIDINRLPDYLTRRNKPFQRMLRETLSTRTVNATSTDIEGLRQIAISVYKIMLIQTHQLLWTTYKMAGTGQIVLQSEGPPVYSAPIPVWPKQIKLAVKAGGATEMNMNEHAMAHVKKYLSEWNKQLQLNRTELNIKANKFTGYSILLQKTIEAYIERNLSGLRTNIEHQVELVVFEYHIQALKVEYNRLKPNTAQVRVFSIELAIDGLCVYLDAIHENTLPYQISTSNG